MTRTARETFLNSPHKTVHEKVVTTESFQVACDYAILVLLEEMPAASDPSKGWDSHSQMTGAKRVIEILKNLHEPIKPHKKVETPSLHYT